MAARRFVVLVETSRAIRRVYLQPDEPGFWTLVGREMTSALAACLRHAEKRGKCCEFSVGVHVDDDGGCDHEIPGRPGETVPIPASEQTPNQEGGV